MASQAKSHFDTNCLDISDVLNQYDALSVTPGAPDYSFILRYAWVMLVSHLDTYIHELIVEKLANSLYSRLPLTEGARKLKVSVVPLAEALHPSTGTQVQLVNCLQQTFARSTFQNADDIAEAISYVSSINPWVKIQTDTGTNVKQLKSVHNLCINRRNQIAHESDKDPGSGQRRNISRADITDVETIIKRIVHSIDSLV